MCLPWNSQTVFGSIYTFAWSNSVHNLITQCVKNYIFPLISSHLIFSLRLQFFCVCQEHSILTNCHFFCRSQDCSGFSPTLLGKTSWQCQSPLVTKWHIAPSGGVLEPAQMNSQLVTAADQRRHILESSSRAGLQRARRVRTNSMPENRAYLGLAVKILYFFFFLLLLTSISLDICSRNDTKPKQKNFPELFSVFPIWIPPIQWWNKRKKNKGF